MGVDDHGLEVLKKSGEEVTSGDKSNYYIKVKGIAGSVQSIDTSGDSIHENGSVGTAAANIPSTAGNVITAFLIENTHASQNILFSIDGGSTFKTVLPNDAYSVEPKGDLTQIQVKGSAASTTYEILMNRKA